MTVSAPQILVHDDTDQLAGAFAARLITRLADLQADGQVPSVVLTGGSIAYTAYRAVVDSPACGAVDWSRVDFWWGDERFVPGDSDDRNAKAAFGSFLDHVGVDRERVHVMPASDGEYGDDVDAAAAAYAEELRAHTPLDRAGEPLFDVLILGIGQNGHCASLMPDAPALDDERPVVAVRDSPKPPPTRISMTFGPLLRARELWWIAAGDDKAGPVHDAVNGADVRRVPAAKPRGLDRTMWLLDRAAASRLR
ncbi:MAG TPA: 6-phosphogluconolactonase [Nocardioidaceae bacterium]|nr:6-phosphogluconolactonase [Nocardioidaceae bacterium]